MKNDLIFGFWCLYAFFSGDNSEIVLVNVYRTWEDIGKTNEVN
ncbi:hypothetical protein [Christiangramia lutea]|nr:hypothetical protein [Christiangramia lutea]